MPIVVIDYRKGNLSSVRRWMEAAGFPTIISTDPDDILAADGLILPGVGSFRDASDTLVASGQMDAIRKRIIDDGIPFLGICLGLQLLVARGDEGCEAGRWATGIGAFEGTCARLNDTCADGSHVKIPHVGWNSVDFEDATASPLFDDVPSGSYFYFTHSYQVVPRDEGSVTSYTTYADTFPTSLRQGDIYGVQFHPEKSSDIGLIVARNFGRIVYPHPADNPIVNPADNRNRS